MFHTFQRFSLEKQLFASFVGFAAVLLLLTMGVSLILDINRQMQSTDSLIRSSASYIASLDSVKNMLKQGYPDPKHAEAGVPRPRGHQGDGLLQREPGGPAGHRHL